MLLSHHTNPARYASIPTMDAGKTALHISCESVHSKVARVLLNCTKDNIDVPIGLTGSTALHVAAAQKSSALIDLLSNGASIDKRDARGRTALHIAAVEDSSQGVAALLRSGANVSAKDRYGLTPADLAHARGNKSTAEMLLEVAAPSDESIIVSRTDPRDSNDAKGR